MISCEYPGNSICGEIILLWLLLSVFFVWTFYAGERDIGMGGD